MNNKIFAVRLAGIFLIAITLFIYQSIAADRAEAVKAEKEAAKAAAVKTENNLKDNTKETATAGDGTAFETENEAGEPVKESRYVDGSYSGSGEGFGGAIVIELTIKDDVIEDVKLISHDGEDDEYFSLAVALLDRFKEENSADVDIISGATLSSMGLIAAANEALGKAERVK